MVRLAISCHIHQPANTHSFEKSALNMGLSKSTVVFMAETIMALNMNLKGDPELLTMFIICGLNEE